MTLHKAVILQKADVTDLAPLVRRAVSLDGSGLVRLRRSGERISAYVRLPFGVLAARTIVVKQAHGQVGDLTVRSRELLEWLDGEREDEPEPRDAEWRTGLPPMSGWHRVDTVPDAEVRPLIRAGALALQKDSVRQDSLGARSRSAVADALLDSVVLTVTDGPHLVAVTLRTLSAITRLGFLPSGSYIAIDYTRRWMRVAAAHGSVYAEHPRSGLSLL